MESKPNLRKILFVCLGNICRSPAAEGVMKSLVARAGRSDAYEIDSAGTYGGHAGEPADSRMQRAALRRGYRLTSISRRIRAEDFDRFDRIVVMDDSNYESVHRLAPTRDAADKIYRMVDFCRSCDTGEVPDPYYTGDRGFEVVLDLLEDACRGLFEDMERAGRQGL